MDPERFTAAHRTFPFGTVLRVTDPDNGRSVVVVVNDRGPFIDGRVLDLSYGAAKAIDMVQKGVAPVQIEVIQVDQSRLATRWRVQLGSFRDESAAKELADEIQAGRTSSGRDLWIPGERSALLSCLGRRIRLSGGCRGSSS